MKDTLELKIENDIILQKSSCMLFEQLELLAKKSKEAKYIPELVEMSKAMAQIHHELSAAAITGNI